LWIIPFFRKPSLSFILILWVINEFRSRKENVLTPLLKPLMPENAMNGAISDGVSDNPGGCDSVYLCSFDAVCTEIEATGRYDCTEIYD
jgi:hypothetical protein